ncbi:MAG: hypothetical protein DLM65_03385 [Candidatus Aeolococcus gillhamiae]|uniref:OmpR/PhoB-type domain-containing protein n=2 Tax=Candidatus Aeolococcus gillhamiae TaxID=3127015 RepID=A0A2W5ZB94_9BACT|nr:MAG: hypothetical protein DLM65_03385 [Candidatus Dormibacter sp. RRmetagenome_bin12]
MAEAAMVIAMGILAGWARLVVAERSQPAHTTAEADPRGRGPLTRGVVPSRTMAARGDLSFFLLGGIEARLEGKLLALGGARQRTVIADLALNARRVVSTRRLVDDLWGDQAPTSAGHSLEAHISRIRGLLVRSGVDGAIVSRSGGYMMDVEPDQVDALRFERLAAEGDAALVKGDAAEAARLYREALEMWRGPALADLGDSPLGSSAGQRLDARRLLVLERQVDAALMLGRHREISGELESLLAVHPYHERFHWQLMLALYRSRRQAEALAAYRRARQTLVDDLGIEPGPELQQLERAILHQELDLELPAEVSHAAGSETFVPGPTIAAPAEADLRSPSPSAPTAIGSARRHRQHRRGRLAAVASAFVLALIAAAAPLLLRGHGGTVTVRPNGLGMLSADGRAVASELALDAPPGQLAAGGGSLWATSPEAHVVYRIDPATQRVTQSISVGGGADGIAIGYGSAWVANALDGTVSRIDLATNRVVDTIGVGSAPTAVAVGEGSVWVADATGGTLERIDPATDRLIASVSLSSPPFDIAVFAGAVWVTSQSANQVLRVNPVTGNITQDIAVGGGPTAVVAGNGSVWVANSRDSTVSAIDPRRGSVAATIPVDNGPSSLAAGAGGVWVANALSGTLSLIDPGQKRVVSSIGVGNRPVAIAGDGADVWFAVRAAQTGQHRGGTLHAESSFPLASIDPANLWPEAPSQLWAYTYDTLVTYQRSGGRSGLQLVPDLAVFLPSPSDGGTTYTFVLRPGVRYSTGQLVRPEDFRHGFERTLELNGAGAGSFLEGITGASACATRPAHCDLSKGITVDERTDTVTFHLTSTDTNFLYKLTFVFTAPVPVNIPARDVGSSPVPSTGPYEIRRFIPGHELDLVRNPRFHEWSAAAQPDGFPDQINWTFGMSPGQEAAAVEHGAADWTSDIGPGTLSEAATAFAGQLHINAGLGTYYLFLNTRVAPFDDVRVRRALNLAVDRSRLVQIFGGPLVAQPACQLLPPSMPGYQPYCPYTADPSPTGAWVGPDLAAARALVAASGTGGERVTVWAHQGDPPSTPTAEYVASVLQQLGYPATVHFLKESEWVSTVSDSRRQVQLGTNNWIADYPAPSNFYTLWLGCSNFVPADPLHTSNASEFCDPGVDQQVSKASALQTTDPLHANALWADIGREITDLAPVLPVVNFSSADLLSRRCGNYQFSPAVGILLDQLWVR